MGIQEMEQQKVKEKLDLDILTGLRVNQSTLEEEHGRLQKEYQAAMERIACYDKNMLEKTRKIKEQQIYLKSMENLLHEKTKEISCLVTDEGHHQVEKLEKESASCGDHVGDGEIKTTKYFQLVPLKDLQLEDEEQTDIEMLSSSLPPIPGETALTVSK